MAKLTFLFFLQEPSKSRMVYDCEVNFNKISFGLDEQSTGKLGHIC